MKCVLLALILSLAVASALKDDALDVEGPKDTEQEEKKQEWLKEAEEQLTENSDDQMIENEDGTIEVIKKPETAPAPKPEPEIPEIKVGGDPEPVVPETVAPEKVTPETVVPETVAPEIKVGSGEEKKETTLVKVVETTPKPREKQESSTVPNGGPVSTRGVPTSVRPEAKSTMAPTVDVTTPEPEQKHDETTPKAQTMASTPAPEEERTVSAEKQEEKPATNNKLSTTNLSLIIVGSVVGTALFAGLLMVSIKRCRNNRNNHGLLA